MIQYSIPTDPVLDPYMKGSIGDIKFEIPGVFIDGIFDPVASAKKVAEFEAQLKQEKLMQAQTPGAFGHQVHVAGALARYDYNSRTPEGQELLQVLKDEFADDVDSDIEKDMESFIGESEPYRPPYTNRIISWYYFEELPDRLRIKYSVDLSRYNRLESWYGRKYNTTTKEIFLKVVFDKFSSVQAEPPLPEGGKFYAEIYNPDGSLDNNTDCYVWADAATMEKYCLDNDVIYPAPPLAALAKTTLWGITYNKSTLEIVVVKGYEFI